MAPGEWLRRVWYLLNRRRLERELAREMQAHREMMGEPRRFGNMLRLREESRDVWGWNWLDDVWRDLKFAGRTLRQSPGFTIGAILVLSIGIGLNVTFFQIYNLVALKPLQVRDVATLVEFHRFINAGPGSGSLPYPMIERIRNSNDVLSAVLVSARQWYVIWADGESQLPASFVSANWFDVIGGQPAAGRLFREVIDGKADAEPVVILSHYFWTRRLNSAPNVVGSTARINGRPTTIIGILPPDYRGAKMDEARMFMPIEQIDYFFPDVPFKTAWVSSGIVEVFGRLKPNISLTAVRESLRPAMNQLALEQPKYFRPEEWLEPYPVTTIGFEDARQRRERYLGVAGISFLSLLVLTIACANLSNMILSRSIARLRELNIRIALGAGRWRVMRLLMAESALLATAATGAAVAMSAVTLDAIAARVEAPINPSIDWRTMVAALSIAAFAMFVVGFLPTWAVSRRDLSSTIKDGGQGASAGLGRSRLRSLLTAVQTAGSCLLLLLAALTARDVLRALTPAFDFDKVAVLGKPSRAGGKSDPAYPLRVRQAIASFPETESLAFATAGPFGTGIRSVVRNLPEAPALVVTQNSVEPQFFGIIKLPIVMGRNFEASDDPQTTAIVSRRLAMRVYGTLNVIGERFPRTPASNEKRIRTIVGVAEDAKAIVLEFPHSGTEYAELYAPIAVQQLQNADLFVRARTDATALLAPMREASRTIDPRLFVETRLLSTDFAVRIRELANLSGIALTLAALTLVLACIGIFGVMSYGAKLRRKEISIRLALGAERRSVVGLLMKQSAWPAASGILIGLAVGLAASRILESQRIYLGSVDGVVLFSVAAVIAGTCALAAAIPALRAVRGDIAQTLRNE